MFVCVCVCVCVWWLGVGWWLHREWIQPMRGECLSSLCLPPLETPTLLSTSFSHPRYTYIHTWASYDCTQSLMYKVHNNLTSPSVFCLHQLCIRRSASSALSPWRLFTFTMLSTMPEGGIYRVTPLSSITCRGSCGPRRLLCVYICPLCMISHWVGSPTTWHVRIMWHQRIPSVVWAQHVRVKYWCDTNVCPGSGYLCWG